MKSTAEEGGNTMRSENVHEELTQPTEGGGEEHKYFLNVNKVK